MSLSKDDLRIGDFVRVQEYNCYYYGGVVDIDNDRKSVNVKIYMCKRPQTCRFYPCRNEKDLMIYHIQRKANKNDLERIMLEEL